VIEAQNEWSYTSAPHICRYDVDKGDFTFTFVGIQGWSGQRDFNSELHLAQWFEPRPVATFAGVRRFRIRQCCLPLGMEVHWVRDFYVRFETDLRQKGKTVSQLSDEKYVVAGIDCGRNTISYGILT
jgi:hypothetical protein